jgi:hypothetical protein
MFHHEHGLPGRRKIGLAKGDRRRVRALTGKNPHSADDAALGFLYQGQYALLLLWRDADDDATVWVETLDDVVLVSNGDTILEQLKHSLKIKPAPLTIASKNLWKTLKGWIDVLPNIDLSHTWLHLVAVSGIGSGSLLELLLKDDNDRDELLDALNQEAERVVQEREDAKAAKAKTLPHAERVAGCTAFLALDADKRTAILSRMRIKPNQSNITLIEDQLAADLTSILKKRRQPVARQLVEWWNGQILDLLTKKRDIGISRFELVKRFMEIVSAIELDELTSGFATSILPSSYKANSMLEQQITLVDGSKEVIRRAVQVEWRAREERSRWSNQNPAHLTTIVNYDLRLVEEWSDRHIDMCAEAAGCTEDVSKEHGRNLLKWSHFEAPQHLEPIAPKIVSPHYVRGAYQILSITGRVGWHPDYRAQLGFK